MGSEKGRGNEMGSEKGDKEMMNEGREVQRRREMGIRWVGRRDGAKFDDPLVFTRVFLRE